MQVLRDAAQAIGGRAARVASAVGEPARLARAAHDMASTAATAGLIELTTLGQLIESLCANGRHAQAQDEAARVPGAVQRALAELASYAGGIAPVATADPAITASGIRA